MNKNLFTMSSLFALALGMASCSSGDDVTSSPLEMAKQNVKAFGTRSTEINMYLGNVKVPQTRGVDVNGNMWSYMPEYPTDAEKRGVLEYVRNNPTAEVPWPGYTYYYVQDVIGAHNQYSYTDWNNAKHDGIDGTSHLDRLEIKENNNNFLHVNNFNAGKCDNAATHNAALMTDGFKGARVHDSYGNTDIENWCIYYYEGNYYLAFDYAMSKDDGSIAADGIYDDWIVKIIPGKGVPPTPPTPPTPPIPSEPLKGEVEFDIHQQEHKDWKEIKTSVHVRDTAAVRVFIPVPYEYQAVADDFDIRTGADYAYIENLEAKFSFAGKEFTFPVQINHNLTGIEILIDCTTDEAKEALKLARGVYDDGITFEINSYVVPTATDAQVWEWLKTITLPGTKTSQWPVATDICTHTYGQVTSAFYPEESNHFDEQP